VPPRFLKLPGTRPSKYPTSILKVGGSFERIIETKQGSYDWPEHNRVRSSVYRYMRYGGRGKAFRVEQKLRDGVLYVVVTRTL
jgi:hypothetical protein